MPFFKKLLNAANELTGRARKFAAPITDQGYLRAALAVGFLVGGADGDFDDDEKTGMLELIKQDPTLSGFSEDQVQNAYGDVDGLFKITMALGRKKALKLIAEVEEADQREALMEFACVISTLNGTVDDDERQMIDKISAAVGIPVDEDLLEV